MTLALDKLIHSARLARRLAVVTCAVATFASSFAMAQESVLHVAMPGDLSIIDPIWTTGHITRNHGYMIYDTLFAMDENGVPKPQMVSDYTVSDDGLVYSMTLRDGLKWHDGKPVTAADCVASLKRWGQKDNLGIMLMEHTASIEAPDDKTLVITLSKPFGITIDVLAEPSGNVPFMMPQRIAETPASEQISDPIGSGPFVFVKNEWVPGDKVVYEKFKDYVPAR